MAWRYPPQHIGPNYVADTSPINEALTAVVGESTGMLNEHNFDSPSTDTNPQSCLLSRSNLADEAAFRVHYATASTLPDPANYKKVGWVEIDSVDGWQTFSDDGCTLEFTAYGGLAWLNASFNVHCGNNARTNVQKGYGYNFAIELSFTYGFPLSFNFAARQINNRAASISVAVFASLFCIAPNCT